MIKQSLNHLIFLIVKIKKTGIMLLIILKNIINNKKANLLEKNQKILISITFILKNNKLSLKKFCKKGT